ncbi:MAG TPA: ABC transporter ATP-binding protein [bacterium]|nr:ABC transporter ATP-binding protein [bacterium]
MRDLRSGYGAVQVIWDVTLRVEAGEIVTLIGNNGAGKTTTMLTLTGLLPVWGGEISFESRRVAGLEPPDIAARGLALVPQGRRLFGAMSVEENLLMGAYLRRDRGVGDTLRHVYDILPRLRERRRQLAGTLSGGEQQMCAIGRALMARPKLLCIDELSFGLAPVITAGMLDVLCEIRAEGTSVLLVEQDVEHALAVADRAYVMEGGRIVLSGAAAQVYDDPVVRTAYLGL